MIVINGERIKDKTQLGGKTFDDEIKLSIIGFYELENLIELNEVISELIVRYRK